MDSNILGRLNRVLTETVVRRCSVKKLFLEISQNSQGKHLCQRLFFNKVAGLRLATLFKKSVRHRCFPVNFVKFLRTLFFTEHLRWLLICLELILILTLIKIKILYSEQNKESKNFLK